MNKHECPWCNPPEDITPTQKHVFYSLCPWQHKTAEEINTAQVRSAFRVLNGGKQELAKS